VAVASCIAHGARAGATARPESPIANNAESRENGLYIYLSPEDFQYIPAHCSQLALAAMSMSTAPAGTGAGDQELVVLLC
jgi:hypothetical protein